MKRILFLCVVVVLAFAKMAGQGAGVENDSVITVTYFNVDTRALDTAYITPKAKSGFMVETLKELRRDIPILIDDIKKRKSELASDPTDVFLAEFIKAQEDTLFGKQFQLRAFSAIKGITPDGKKIKLEQSEENEQTETL